MENTKLLPLGTEQGLEETEYPSFDLCLGENMVSPLVAQHRQWLKTIRHEVPNPKVPFKVAVYIRFFNQTKYRDEEYLERNKEVFRATLAQYPMWEFVGFYIDPEFKTLIRPLRKDEYLQLEVNLAVDGCREPIITWNNIIVDGHNRYEICNRLHIPYAIREMPFENREQAIVWICSNQLGRRNITEETRRYLIGKQYELEKVARKHPPNINGFNQYKRRNKGERGDTFRRTAQKFSAQYNVSTGSVQKYAIFSKALDVVGQADPELPGKVLSGTFKISHENLVALSKMPPEEIRRIGSKPEDLQHPFTSYSDTRKEFADTDEEPVEPMQETLPLIKITPMHDPDAEIAGLTLTVPSWVSSIERARNNADMNAASTGAKSRLEEALLSLQEKVSEMLSDIREVD